MEPQERHYNINKLNVIFAVSSVILLFAVLWLLKDDYSREWKDYQREFRALEIQKTRAKYDDAARQLESNEEYKTLLAQVETARKDFEANCNAGELKTKQTGLSARNDLLNQRYKFARAEYDAARYRYESIKDHGQGPEFAKAEKEINRLGQKLGELKTAVEDSDGQISAQRKTLDDCGMRLKELERQKRALANKAGVLQMKLAKIDPDEMSFANRLADRVRNFPIIDLANPNDKIEQVVLSDIHEDLNFMQVPKVDRCTTCHLGIANPDYQDAPQPFKTHPKLDLYLSNDSSHPLEEFGCTVCHGGRGRGTDFISTAHAPSSSQQAKQWEEKYGWHEFHHWETPMLPMPYVEAGCFKCHSGQTAVKGAEKLNLGLNIIEKAGCYNCHAIERYRDWPKPGPDLTKLGSKISKDWAYLWIENPRAFRPNTWMPSFFKQSNTNDPQSLNRAQQEIHAIVSYLFDQSQDYASAEMPSNGDPQKGKTIVASVGCLACHRLESLKEGEPTTRETLRREHGPNLIGLGDKTSPRWIYRWLKDPHSYNPHTKMPNLRLSDEEAADAAAYLVSLGGSVNEARIVPPLDEAVVDQITLDFLVKSDTRQAAQAKLAGMNLKEKLHYSGLRLIRHYGCFSCHNIAGFEKDKPIGTELTEEGSKSVDRLDFGFVDIEHSKQAWFTQKLKDPRIFDQGRIKSHDEKLRMPNFGFSDEETEAVVTALLGFVKDRPESKVVPRTPANLSIEEGQAIVRLYNCQGCHLIENEGSAIRPMVKEWLVNYDNRSETEADALVTSFSPPNLIGEGKKVQTKWFFDFLHEPLTIRPWLKVRMPTYKFDAPQINVLVKYFNALDKQDFPFTEKAGTALSDDELKMAEKLFSKNYFDCSKCHIVGAKLPSGSPENWAPNFALAQSRLKPQWIIDWLKNPQDLLPGTKMPTYFDPQYFDTAGPDDILGGDEHAQIRLLRDYLMTLTEPSPNSSPAPAAETSTSVPVAPANPPAVTPSEDSFWDDPQDKPL